MKDFLTVTEFAATVNVSGAWVVECIHRDRIEAEKAGPIWLIPVGEVERFQKAKWRKRGGWRGLAG